MAKPEPFLLSRELASVAPAYRLFAGATFEAAARRPPPARKLFPSKTLFDELGELDDRDPLKAPCLGWVMHLLMARVTAPEVLETKRIKDALPLGVEEFSAEFTLRQLGVGSLAWGARAERALEQRVELGKNLGALRVLVLEKEEEVLRRLGAEPAFAPGLPRGFLANASERLLALAEHQGRTSAGLFAFHEKRLARGAEAGLPARLSGDTILELSGFSGVARKHELEAFPLPARLAPSSFALGLGRFGEALCRARIPKTLPFVVARAPGDFSEKVAGTFFSSLLGSETFLRRRLGLSRAEAERSRRCFLASLGAEGERLALSARLGLFGLSKAERNEFALHSTRAVFARSLGLVEWCGLFPVGLRSGHDLASFLLGVARAERAIEEYDEDFFDNPRFQEEFIAELSAPSPLGFEEKTLNLALEGWARRLEAVAP